MRREQVKLNVQLRPDHATMEFNIVTDHRMLAGVILSAEELDRVMAGLADIRSKMTPEVPVSFQHDKPTHRHDATKYIFGLDPFSEQFLMSFRSPGFGWLTFPVGPAEIEKMYGQLQAHKSRPAAPHSDKKQ